MDQSSDSFMHNCPHSLFRGCSESQILSSLFSIPQGWLVPNLHSPDPKTSSSSPSLLQHSSPSLCLWRYTLFHCVVQSFSLHFIFGPAFLMAPCTQSSKPGSSFMLSCKSQTFTHVEGLAPWLVTSARPLRLWLYPVLLAYTNALRCLS